MKSMSCCLAGQFLFWAFQLQAGIDPTEAFDRLKSMPVDYTVEGVICEQLIALQLEEDYPVESFDIKIGVVYADKNRILGELDVVVFRTFDERDHDHNKERQAVAVVEVKCTYHPSHMLPKARSQLQRFADTVSSHRPVRFFLATDPSQTFQSWQFEDSPLLQTGSVEGSETVGYDMELPFGKDEAMAIRSRLRDCQRQGECPVSSKLSGPKLKTGKI